MPQTKASFERKEKLKSYFYGVDIFSYSMQTNFEGKEKFGSIHGVVLSLIYYSLMILYM